LRDGCCQQLVMLLSLSQQAGHCYCHSRQVQHNTCWGPNRGLLPPGFTMIDTQTCRLGKAYPGANECQQQT
jgi:hypothetical protein